jgi:hypothetical protein
MIYKNSEDISLEVINTTTDVSQTINIDLFGFIGVINDKLFILRPHYYSKINIKRGYVLYPYEASDEHYAYTFEFFYNIKEDGSIDQYSITDLESHIVCNFINNGFIYNGGKIWNDYDEDENDHSLATVSGWSISPIPVAVVFSKNIV